MSPGVRTVMDWNRAGEERRPVCRLCHLRLLFWCPLLPQALNSGNTFCPVDRNTQGGPQHLLNSCLVSTGLLTPRSMAFSLNSGTASPNS